MKIRSRKRKKIYFLSLCMFLLLVCGWGKVNDPTSQDGKSQVLDEIREDGSRMDSFYQESLLLEYHFHIPQVEGLSRQAAEKVKDWWIFNFVWLISLQ